MRFEYFNPSPKKRVRADGTPMKWHKGDCTTRMKSMAMVRENSSHFLFI